MSDGQGMELLTEVRSGAKTKDIPVVMMSADQTKIEEGEESLLMLGASTCVLKPFNLSELQELIHNLLGTGHPKEGLSG